VNVCKGVDTRQSTPSIRARGKPLRWSDKKRESLTQQFALIASIAEVGTSPTLGGMLGVSLCISCPSFPASQVDNIQLLKSGT
jgi:hypothetical protein